MHTRFHSHFRARYKTLVNEARVLSFATQIRENGFNDSQIEIDDR